MIKGALTAQRRGLVQPNRSPRIHSGDRRCAFTGPVPVTADVPVSRAPLALEGSLARRPWVSSSQYLAHQLRSPNQLRTTKSPDWQTNQPDFSLKPDIRLLRGASRSR